MNVDHVLQRLMSQQTSSSPKVPYLATSVGTIIKTAAEVFVISADSTRRKALVGEAVFRGEIVATVSPSPHCNVTIRLTDGTEMCICENACVRFAN